MLNRHTAQMLYHRRIGETYGALWGMWNVATPMGSGFDQYANREGGGSPQRAQEVPRSEGRMPKGTGNP